MKNKIKKERKIEGGFTRSSNCGKIDYTLIPREVLDRLGSLYTKGAEVHGRDNWKLGCNNKGLESFRSSAFRHFISWLDNEDDEDHYAACIWNMNGAEYVKNNKNG